MSVFKRLGNIALSLTLLNACAATKPSFDWSGEYTNLDPAEQMKQYGVTDDAYDGIRIVPYVGNQEDDLKALLKDYKEFADLAELKIDEKTQLSKWMVEINSYQSSDTYQRQPMLAFPEEWYEQAAVEISTAHRNGQFECLYNAIINICPQVTKVGDTYKINPNIIELRGFMTYHNYQRHPLGSGAIKAARGSGFP